MYEPELKILSPEQGSAFFQSDDYRSIGVKEIARDYHFNHQLTVTVSGALPNTFKNTLMESEYCYVEAVDVSDLLNDDFVQAFCDQGYLYVLSNDTWLDRDDCLCIYPYAGTSHLMLLLNEDTAHKIAHPNVTRHSCYSNKKVLNIELKLPKMKDGWTKRREKLRGLLKFNLLISWTPPDSSVDERSVPAYLESLGYSVHICKPRITAEVEEFATKIPSLDKLDNVMQQDATDILEWLGRVETVGTAELRSCPKPHRRVAQLSSLSVSGFFPGFLLLRILHILRKIPYIYKVAFVSLSIHGFQDSPVLWQQQPHCSGTATAVLLWTSQHSLAWWSHSTEHFCPPSTKRSS